MIEEIASLRADVAFYERFVGLMDHQLGAFGDDVEVIVGHERRYLDDHIAVRFEAGHFQVHPHEHDVDAIGVYGARMADMDVPVKAAATVMLLRDTTSGVEVFMLRRTQNAAFAGGMYVFPGGKVDPADGEGDEAYRVAAVRECYEEAGVLLAAPVFVLVGIAWLVMTIIASIKANEGVAYRYPLALRLVR